MISEPTSSHFETALVWSTCCSWRHDTVQLLRLFVTTDASQFAGLAMKDVAVKDAMYGAGNLQSTPCMKTFYNKALLSATEPYACSDIKQPAAGGMMPQIAPGVLPVTGSAFRPVQQSAYIIRPQTGGASSTDSCVKPDASSTSSNNETGTNNDISAGLWQFCHDSLTHCAEYKLRSSACE